MNRLLVACLGALTGACIARGLSLWLTLLCAAVTIAFASVGGYVSRREERAKIGEARREASDAAAGVFRIRVATMLDALRARAVPAGLREHPKTSIARWVEARGTDHTKGYLKALDEAEKVLKGWEL